MAQYVTPERLWPLLAYFAGAVLVMVGANVVADVTQAAPSTRWAIVLLWLILTPVGAWRVWKRAGRDGK